jgi:hypothetical protein
MAAMLTASRYNDSEGSGSELTSEGLFAFARGNECGEDGVISFVDTILDSAVEPRNDGNGVFGAISAVNFACVSTDAEANLNCSKGDCLFGSTFVSWIPRMLLNTRNIVSFLI